MNPSPFIVLNIVDNPENFTEELKTVIEVMHVGDSESLELTAYQLNGIVRTWFDQSKEGRYEDSPHLRWAYFEEDFLGLFFP